MRLATASAPRPAAGTSRQTTCAPSRASVSAIASPMPRDAPVTTAAWPASGLSQSSGSVALAGETRMTCASTYADRAPRQEAQRRGHRVLGAGLDVDEVRRRALAADLLGRARA